MSLLQWLATWALGFSFWLSVGSLVVTRKCRRQIAALRADLERKYRAIRVEADANCPRGSVYMIAASSDQPKEKR